MKRYEVKLTTIGPVHVGSGEILNKSSYIYDKEARMIHILDERKMMKWIIKNKLDKSFEKYFMSNNQKNKTLYDWIKSNNLTKEYKEIISYSLSTASLQRAERPINDIALMIKNEENNPYIPGTSLKGALRTILFAKMFDKEDTRVLKEYLQSREKAKDRIDKLSREAKKCEKGIFNKKITEKETKSIMNNLLVADSEPILRENLILAQKIDRKPNRQKTSKALSIYRESIKPGVEIKFNITIKDELGIGIEEIEDGIQDFYLSIDDNFLVNFDVEERDGLYIYLGGGSGFQTKTVVYPALDDFGKTETNTNVVRRILDDRYPRKGHIKSKVSPQVLKTTMYKREQLEMGLCKISFKEI